MKYTKESIITWINELSQSGQTIKEFCRDKPFHPSSLRYWISKASQPSRFIEVKAKTADALNAQIYSIEIRYPNGVTMSLVKPLSIADLVSLVKC